MKYTIKLTDLANKMLKDISDERIRMKIIERIDKLTDNPALQGKPLKGIFAGYRSIRAVGQRYRIVYKVIEEEVIVYVIGVGIRKEGNKVDIYTRLRRIITNDL
ncbi:MAG: type II toxin-antitoxin system RelE/ParE family toxin [bacterium]